MSSAGGGGASLPILIGGGAVVVGLGLALSSSARASVTPRRPAVLPKRRSRTHGDPTKYMPIIRRAAARHDELRNRVAVLVGLLDAESRFDPTAGSKTGADGIAQFTSIGRQEVRDLMQMPGWRSRFNDDPALARRLAAITEADSYDPTIGIEAGALYLSALIYTYKNVEAALTAYNAGGVAAKLVVKAGSHAKALPDILKIPEGPRSQADTYAPEVLANADYFHESGFAGEVLANADYYYQAGFAGWEDTSLGCAPLVPMLLAA